MVSHRRHISPCVAAVLPAILWLGSAAAQDEVPKASGSAAPDDEAWIDIVWPGQATPPGDHLRVGGLISLEAINWDSGNAKDDGFETENLSLLLSGRIGRADFFVDIDLEGEDTRHNLREAWVETGLGIDHWVRAGWLRVAHGSELATREEDLPFPGYGFPSWQNGRFGPGVAADGYALPWFWWQATVTAGHDADLAGNALNEPQGLLRLMATPVRGADGSFEGLFGGFGISRTTDLDGPVHVETPFEQVMFMTDDLHGDSRSFVSFELGYRGEQFRAGGEVTDGAVHGVELPSGQHQTYDQIGRYAFWCSWNLRGPVPLWSRGRWLPYRLGPTDELPLELALRYSNADIDRRFFTDGLATFGPSVNEARTITASVTYWLQPSTRVGFSLLDTVSDQPSDNWGLGDVSWMLRLDQHF